MPYAAVDPAADDESPAVMARASALEHVDLSRPPRVSDGDQYAAIRVPRVSDGERFSPTPVGSHPLA